MKRIILILLAIFILGITGTYAQTANRKGVFIDAQVGNTFGYIYKSEKEDVNGKPLSYLKGGIDLGVSVGMRFPTARHWAFQFKLATSLNPEFIKGADLNIKVGMRWISKDFAGSKSAFAGLNSGFGMNPGIVDIGCNVPIDFEAGVNLTNKIAVGIYFTEKIFVYDGRIDYSYEWHDREFMSNNATAGVRFSYRF